METLKFWAECDGVTLERLTLILSRLFGLLSLVAPFPRTLLLGFVEKQRRNTRTPFLSWSESNSIKLLCLPTPSEKKHTLTGETCFYSSFFFSIWNVLYNYGRFCFFFSLRRTMVDNVSQEVKVRRLSEIVDTFHHWARKKNNTEIGSTHLVLVEGTSKRNSEQLSGILPSLSSIVSHINQKYLTLFSTGRTDTNKKVNFSDVPVVFDWKGSPSGEKRRAKPGDYVVVKIDSSTGMSLQGAPLGISGVVQFANYCKTERYNNRNKRSL